MNPIRLAALGLLLATSSCSNGPEIPDVPTNTVQIAIQDAPVDGLQSFSVVLTRVDLLDRNGEFAASPGMPPRRIEFVELQQEAELFSRGLVYGGTFGGLRIHFDPTTIQAISASGELVPVTSSVDTFDVPFSDEVRLGTNDRIDLIVDLDLGRSVRGSVSTPPLTFVPVARRIPFNAGTYPLTELDGYASMRSGDTERFRLQPDVWEVSTESASETTAAVADIEVELRQDAVLLDSNGTPFADQAAFFASFGVHALSAEVQGDLRPDGSVLASRVELGGNVQISVPSEVGGRVTAVDSEGTFDLLILDIEHVGISLSSIIAQLSPPYRISVLFGDATQFIDDETHQPLQASDLAVGQRIDLRLMENVGSLTADRVEIESPPRHWGTLTDTSGAPSAATFRLAATAPAVASGLVANATTDIAVDLSSARLVLSARDTVPLEGSALVPDVHAQVSGPITGDPTTPSLVASEVLVTAGEMTGTVSGVSTGTSSFDVAVTSVTAPLGGNATSPPFSVTIDPACTFHGAAGSASTFFALFTSLGQGESLRVEVTGLGTATPNEVRAYAIRSRVE